MTQQKYLLLFILLLLFSSTQISYSQAITTYWVKGVEPQDISKFEDGKRAQVYPGCGFYNFRKQFYQNVNNMCWLATSSNLVHWWLTNNKAYLDRFNYSGPYKYWNEDTLVKSEVFNYYLEKGIQNFGGNDDIITNSFLCGGSYQGISFEGFFSDVFGYESRLMGKWFRKGEQGWNDEWSTDWEEGWVNTDERLYKCIKSAIDKNRALSLTYTWSGGSFHVINVWGADVDESSKRVTALYTTDSDALPGMKRTTLNYKKRTYDDGSFEWKSYFGETVELWSMLTLDLGTEQWEAYFAPNSSTFICCELKKEDMRVYSKNKRIHIENVLSPVTIYTTFGQQIYRNSSPNQNEQIEVSSAGVYLVKIGNETRKVAVY